MAILEGMYRILREQKKTTAELTAILAQLRRKRRIEIEAEQAARNAEEQAVQRGEE